MIALPNAGFAGAFLNSFIDAQHEERARKETNTRDVINFLIQSGRVRDYNDLLPMMGSLFPGLQQGKGGKGGGGKPGGGGGAGGGKGGQSQDPNSMLAQWLNPAFKMATEGATAGQRVTSGPGAGPLMSDAEVQQRTDTATQHAEDIKFGGWQREEEIRQRDAKELAAQSEAARLRDIQEQNKGRYGPGTLQGRVQAEIEKFTVANGRPPDDTEYPRLIDDARAAWQAAGRKVTDPEAYTKSWLADAVTENKGQPLTPGQEKLERLKARKAWALAGQQDVLGREEALARFKTQLALPSPADLKELSRTVTIGDTSTAYIDTASVWGVKDRAAVNKIAIESGIVPVTAKEAEQLGAAGAASENLTGFLDQIKSKLPADAQSRPLTAIENKLQQYFQTDEQLASAVSWDITIFPMLRAMQVSNRINMQEMALALAARPKITDTVGTAAQKVATLQRILGNGTKQVLRRGGGGGGAATPTPTPGSGGPPGSGGQSGGAPADVLGVLKGKPAGHYKLSDGTEWDVLANGAVTAAKKAS